VTESKWLATRDPTAMLRFLRDRASDRKLRLFACADLRYTYRDQDSPYARTEVAAALRLAERWADEGACPTPTLDDLRACAAVRGPADEAEATAILMNKYALLPAGRRAAAGTVRQASSRGHFPCPDQRKQQARLLRDVFGNPFRPAAVCPAWLNPTVTALARSAYDERPSFEGTLDPARLAVLSDALEEAGCDDGGMLGHLRSPGPHVRGCWALDLILGKR
jgi:hypothetical protein